MGKVDIESVNNKTTYLFLTEHSMVNTVDPNKPDYAGLAWPSTPCTGAECKTTFRGGNFAMVFGDSPKEAYTLVHELGHTFSLPHTFVTKGQTPDGDVHYFYQGYTDNIVDYAARVKPAIPSPSVIVTETLNKYACTATFKWQWNIMRDDNTVFDAQNEHEED